MRSFFSTDGWSTREREKLLEAVFPNLKQSKKIGKKIVSWKKVQAIEGRSLMEMKEEWDNIMDIVRKFIAYSAIILSRNSWVSAGFFPEGERHGLF